MSTVVIQRRAAAAEGAAATDLSSPGAGRSLKLVITANGPRLVVQNWDTGTLSQGDEIAPDGEGNTGVVTAWGADTLTLAGGASDVLSSNYWAAWELPWLGNAYAHLTGSVRHLVYANWPVAFRFGWGLFRSAAAGDLSWGGGFGLAGQGVVATATDNAWLLGAGTTNQREVAGTFLSSAEGAGRGREWAAFGTAVGGVDSTRSRLDFNKDTAGVPAGSWWLYLLASGTGTVQAGDIEAYCQVSPWGPA